MDLDPDRVLGSGFKSGVTEKETGSGFNEYSSATSLENVFSVIVVSLGNIILWFAFFLLIIIVRKQNNSLKILVFLQVLCVWEGMSFHRLFCPEACQEP